MWVGGNMTFCRRICSYEYGRQDHVYLSVYATSREDWGTDVDDTIEGVDFVWVGVL